MILQRFQRWLAGFLGFTPDQPPPEPVESVLHRQKAQHAEKIDRFNRLLASRAALRDVLRGQARDLELEQTRLETALRFQAQAPVPDTSAAAELAVRLDNTTRDLEEVRVKLQEAETSYEQTAASREEAIEQARAELARLKDVLGHDRVAEALAEILKREKR